MGLRARLYPHVPHLEREAARFEPIPRSRPRSRGARSRPRHADQGRRRIGRALRGYVKTLDESALGRAHYGHEQLDQLVTELLLVSIALVDVTLVAGVDSSTKSTKVVIVESDDGKIVASASARHPAPRHAKRTGPMTCAALSKRGKPAGRNAVGESHLDRRSTTRLVALDGNGEAVHRPNSGMIRIGTAS